MAGASKTYDRKNDKPTGKSTSSTIRIGIFMDGTCNNSYNVQAREDYEKEYKVTSNLSNPARAYKDYGKSAPASSYNNDHTNVNLLYQSYINQPGKIEKIYMEGSGTVYDKEKPQEYDRYSKDDAMDGTGFGNGRHGIRGKTFKALEDVAELCNKDTTTIIFDLFGFSRGAASARNIAYEIFLKKGLDIRTDPQGIYRDSFIDDIEMNEPNIIREGNVTDLFLDDPYYDPPAHANKKESKRSANGYRYVKYYRPPSEYIYPGGFLGYFLGRKALDITKIKLVIRFVGIFDTVVSQSLLSPLPMFKEGPIRTGQDFITKKTEKIVHLTAEDEHRMYFSLTPVKKTPKLFEYSMPGVHSDVGGGYVHEAMETKNVGGLLYDTRKKWLVDNYYGVSEDFTKKKYNLLLLKRKRTARYSRIPLKIMSDLGDRFNESQKMFDKDMILGFIKLESPSTKYVESLRPDIRNDLKNMILEYNTSPENLKKRIKKQNEEARIHNKNNKGNIVSPPSENYNDKNAIRRDNIKEQRQPIHMPSFELDRYEGIDINKKDDIVTYIINKYYWQCLVVRRGYIDDTIKEVLVIARKHIEECISQNKKHELTPIESLSIDDTLQKTGGLDILVDFAFLQLVGRLIRCKCIHWSSDVKEIPHIPVIGIIKDENPIRQLIYDDNAY